MEFAPSEHINRAYKVFVQALVAQYEKLRQFYNKLMAECVSDYNKFEYKLPFTAPALKLNM